MDLFDQYRNDVVALLRVCRTSHPIALVDKAANLLPWSTMRIPNRLSLCLLAALCLTVLPVPSDAFVAPVFHGTTALNRLVEPSSSSLQSFGGDLKGIADFFKPRQPEDLKPVKPKFDTVLINPDYRVGVLFLVLGGLFDMIPYIQLTLGPFITLLGLLFVVQAARIRFIFDEDSIELLNKGEQAGEFRSSGENVIVGKPCRLCTSVFNALTVNSNLVIGLQVERTDGARILL